MSVTAPTEVVNTLLPWVGGMFGATLLYFSVMVFIAYRKAVRDEERLREIQRDIGILQGLLLALMRNRKGVLK